MIDAGPTAQPTVMVCITCRTATDLGNELDADAPRAGSALADATLAAAAAAAAAADAADATAAPDVNVQRIRCLGNCSRGLSAAIRCENAWTYVFGGLDPARDGPSLIIGARLLAQAADGIMPWRGRPDSLKRGLIARVPPINFREELP
jgi:predicted metal-binding protein